MASTYSPNLRLELIGTGEQQGTWGSTTNTNLGTLLEEAIGGYTSITISDGGDTTLTTNNGSADQARNMVLNLTGTLTATRNLIAPAIEKVYIVKNATSGGYAVTFKVSGQTGVSIPNGSTFIVYVDGTDVRQVTQNVGTIATQNSNSVTITGGSITGLSDLNVANATVASTVRTNLGLGSIATQNANAVAITGGTITANASGLSIRDADASHILTLAVGSNLTANTTLTLSTGTTDRTLDISASNVTVTVAGAAILDDASAADQRVTLGAAASGNVSNSDLTMATSRLLGRTTANTGAVEQISVGSGLTLSSGSLSVGSGPAFSAYRTSTQSASNNTSTKILFEAEDFDTASCFDAANGRFTPTTAGYYVFTYSIMLAGTALTFPEVSVLKNGTPINISNYIESNGTISTLGAVGSVVAYANGTTDYFELYAYAQVTSGSVSINSFSTNRSRYKFTGCFLRGA